MALAAATEAACGALLTQLSVDSRLPGVVAAAFAPAGIAWEGRRGDTFGQYRIGSLTKTFTAVAVLQLRELGRVDLADAIADHVADSPCPRVTLRELLAHCSGMTAEPAGPWWERSPGVGWDHLKHANHTQVEIFRRGQRYHYSNLGFALLGELVARQRNMSWYDAVRLHVLAPLGLDQTTYHPSADAANGTSRDPRTTRLVGEPAFDSLAMAPAGQLWSTPADLARWGSFLVSGDDAVLPKSVLVEMRTAQSADPDVQHLGAYGLGVRLRWRPHGTLVGHTGSMPGFLAAMFVDSTSGVGSVVLTNAMTGLAPETAAARLVDLVEPELAAAEPEAPAIEVSHLPAAELGGEWYWGNTSVQIQPAEAGFTLSAGADERTFRHLGDDAYLGLDGYYAGERLQVVRRSDGAISHLEVVTFVLTRIPYDPAAPIPGGPPGDPLSWPG